jgi:hypothetical protein
MNNAVYQLHMPRTSGVFIRNTLKSYSKENNKKILAGHDFKINIDDFANQDYICGHYALTPIPYSETTFTILRDPIERSFSYMKYIWNHSYQYMSMDKAFDFFLKKENLREFLSNQQSNFLTATLDIEKYNERTHDTKTHHLNGWSLKTKDIDKDSVIKSIIDNNIQVLFFNEPDLHKKVFNIFKLENIQHVDFLKKVNESPKADAEFYKKWYDEIYNINQVDIEVYKILRKENI